MCSSILQNFEKNCWATFISNFLTQPVQYTSRRRIINEKKMQKTLKIWKINFLKNNKLQKTILRKSELTVSSLQLEKETSPCENSLQSTQEPLQRNTE